MSIEPLSDDLKALFEDEPLPKPSQAAAARVLGRVAAVVAMGSLPDVPLPSTGATTAATTTAATTTAATTTASLGARAIVLAATTFVLGGGVGSAITVAVRSEPRVVTTAPIASVAHAAPPSASIATAPVLTPNDLPDAEPQRVVAAVVPSATTAAAKLQDGGESLGEERVLIESARAKLASGAPAEALRELDEHAKKFPKPRLEEEREALAIQALVNLTEHEAARTRASTFRKRWPTSVYLPAVDTTLRSIP